MPSDEGALERFLASALATILTIIFSWHIIIDVYNEDTKSRRQITDTDASSSKSAKHSDTKTHRADLAKPQPSTSAGIQNSEASAIVTSQQGDQNKSTPSETPLKSIIKEYKLTAATISRLEAVPDPIEIVSRSAHKVDNGESFEEKVVEPVLSSRTLPEEDSVDVRLVNRDVARVLGESRGFIAARASPDDFDSVPLYSDSGESSPVDLNTELPESQGRIQRTLDTSDKNCDNSLKASDSLRKTCDKVKVKGKPGAMFDESWDMDPVDDDVHHIYGDDHDSQNSRDFFFVPVDYEDSSEDDEDRVWRARILEAISEEDEEDLSSSYHSSDEENRFSDDSLNVPEPLENDNSKLEKNMNVITVDSDKSECDVNSNQCDSSTKDSYFDVSDGIKNGETSTNLDGDVISSARYHDNAMRLGLESNKMASVTEAILPSVDSELDRNRFSPSSPLLNEQTRQLCSSCEGLNTLEPSLSSLDHSGIVGRAALNDISTMVDKTSYCNGDTAINLSNFDDSKLEYLEDSYRDSDLSDCCKPVPRGFIFSQSEELESTSEIVSSNYYLCKEDIEDNSSPGVDDSSVSCGVHSPCIDRDQSGDRYSVQQPETRKTDLNFKIPTAKTDSVYVIDLKDTQNGEETQTNDEVRNQLLEQEQILDSKILVSSENSSGDESSTTTGETAILNPGNRDVVTDDDVSEISEIDIDIIRELQSVAAKPPSCNKHKVTDLDASSSDTEDSSDDNSDSSDSFEFNKDDSHLEREIPPQTRNLAVLDELEEEEESSDDSDEFHDASQDSNDFQPNELASSGSSSSPEETNINPYPSDLSVAPIFADMKESHRTIVKRQRIYPDKVSVPELGFFPQSTTEEAGTQTIRSYRQPAVCTINPERYFHPFRPVKTPFEISTEYNTGEVEIRRFVDVGIQVKFDPLWDKTDQKLVLSPSATPPRGSPVQCEGKLQPKELFFQYDNLNTGSDENVFPVDSFDQNLGVLAAQRIRRPSSERRPSYEAIDESEEDLLEESIPVLNAPPKPSDQTKSEGKIQNQPREYGDDVLQATVISCKGFDKSSEEDEKVIAREEPSAKPLRPKNKISEILSSTEISTKIFDQSSSDDEPEQEKVHRSPPKRRHRKSPTKSRRPEVRSSSEEDEKLVVERVHITDSSDADDESDEDARVPLMAKSDQSPLTSPCSPPKVESFIKPITAPSEEAPPRSRESPPSRVHISPRPRPVPAPRVRPHDFISTAKVSPIEVKTPKPLYDVFSRPEKEDNTHVTNGPTTVNGVVNGTPEVKERVASPQKVEEPTVKSITAPVEKTSPERRVQSAMTIELKSRPRTTAEPATSRLTTPSHHSKSPPAGNQTDSRYNSVLTEPIKSENKNISHLFTLPDKSPLPEREKINSARQEYLAKQQQQNNEEERKKLLSRLLGTRDWSERDVPKPKSILKKTSQSFSEPRTEDLPVGYKPTNLDTPNLANLCKSTEDIKERISRVVERKKSEDRERSRSRGRAESTEFQRGRPERRTLPANFRSSAGRAKSLDSLMDNKSMSLPRTDSSGNLYRSPSITLNKSLSGFFSDRKSYTNLLETDLDSESVKVIPLVKETDLDQAAKTASSGALNRTRSKSETRGSSFRPIIAEVYNDTLEKTKSLEQLSENKVISLSVYDTPEVVPVKKDSNRLSKSLGQLDLPDWYVNAPRKPEDVDFGLSCTKTPPSSTSTSFDQNRSFRSNASFDSSRATILHTRVTPPRRTPSPKPVAPFELPSERFRRGHVPLSSRKIVSKMRPPGSKSMEDLVSKDFQPVEFDKSEIPKSDHLSQKPVSNEKEMPMTRGTTATAKVEEPLKPIEEKEKKPVVAKINQQAEIKAEIDTKPKAENNAGSRFTSSATVQLKPAAPPKPLVMPAAAPEPLMKPVSVPEPVMKPVAAPELFMKPVSAPEHTMKPIAAPEPTMKPVAAPELSKPVTAPTSLPKRETPITKQGSLKEKHSPTRPVAPPPPPPETKITMKGQEIVPQYSAEPEPEFAKPVEQKLADCIFDIPFVDETPQNEEAASRVTGAEAELTYQMQKPQQGHFRIQKPEEPYFEIQKPKETTFEIQKPKETTFEMQKPQQTTFEIQKPQQTTFEIQKPQQTTFEMQKPQQTTFEIQKPKETTFELQKPRENTFQIQRPREPNVDIQRPKLTTFGAPKPKEPIAVDVSKPAQATFEISRSSEPTFAIMEPRETYFEKESEFIPKSSDTHSRLQAPTVQAACQPLQPKSFSTTPTQFYALNVIETDLDTSATTGSHRSQESLNDGNSDPSATETKKPSEVNVGTQIQHPPFKKPTPIETTFGNSPRSPLVDDVTPRSPRETSFVSRPSPKLDSNPSSPRETSFLSKGKERSHFVFPKAEASQETVIDEPVKVNQNMPRFQTFQRPAPPEIVRNQAPPTYQRPRAAALETSVDSSPTLQRYQRHPPRPEPSPIPPSAPRDSNVNFTTSTPIVRNQNSLRSQPRAMARETDIDADIVQQPRSPPVQFERSLDNDSFRFNAPQSESTPLNLSLESNPSMRQRPRAQSRETDIDGDLPQRPPPRRGPPPVPYRQPRAPPPPPGSSSGPPRSSYHPAVETNIDEDLPVPPTRNPRSSRPGSLTSRPRNSSRPGSVASQTGSLSDGYFEPEVDLATFKRMASEDPLVSTSSPRASPLDAGFNHAPGAPTYAPDHYIAPGAPGSNTFGTNVRIDHSQSVYRPTDNGSDSSHNTSLVEVLDGLLGMENSPRNSDDFSDPNRKRVVSEAKFDVFNDIKRLNQDLTLIKCRNSRCGKTLRLRQARTVYVSCTLCYSYYCTENCRSIHYTRHEEKCSFSKVENSCKLVARRLITDSVLSHQISGIARTGYQSKGRGCVLVALESPLQCDQLMNSTRFNGKLHPMFVSMADLDSSPKIADSAMDSVVDYNPNSHFILNVCCQITRRNIEFVKHCESFPLTAAKAPVIAVNERLPREQWFYSVQNQLREHGVDLRQQYPDVYNQIIQYINHKTPFAPVTIYPVDSASGQTLFCSIAQDQPAEIRPVAWNRGQAVDRRPAERMDRNYSKPGGNYNAATVAPPRGEGYRNTGQYRAPAVGGAGQRAPAGNYSAPAGNYSAPTGRPYASAPRQSAPVGGARVPARPMYQPPKRVNPASKETEL